MANPRALMHAWLDRMMSPVRMSQAAAVAFVLLAPAAAVGSCSGSGTTTTTTTTTTTASTTTTTQPVTKELPPGGALSLSVSGTKLVNGDGDTVQLRGVNRPGMEYACSQMNQFISDPWSAGGNGVNTGKTLAYADTVASSLLTWDKPGTPGHAVNTVRIPLNEECWLGINGAPAAYSGANYQAFLKRLVDKLTAQDMYVVLALHWGAPGTWLPGKDEKGASANGQNLAPNKDHSVTFWKQVATAYKDKLNVVFDLWTEPGISCTIASGCPKATVDAGYAQQDAWAWNLYKNGGSYTYSAGDGDMYKSRAGQTWQVAGTQELTNTIRAAGADNVIAVETLGYGNGLMDMMGKNLPSDPKGNVMASIHTYDFSGFHFGTAAGQSSTEAQLLNGMTSTYGKTTNVTGQFPLYIGEFGTTGKCGAGGTDTSFTTNTMKWADAKGYSYTAWGWDSGEGCWGPSLVANFRGDDDGTPTAYGADVKAHLQSKQG